MENKQNLGIKVFYYYIFKNILAIILLLIISIKINLLKIISTKGLTHVISFQTSNDLINTLIFGLFIIIFLVLIINIILSWLKYKSCFFIIGESIFTIKTGFFKKEERSIPYKQIQNINIEQSFSYRLMGICELHILTAGNDKNEKKVESEVNLKIIDIGVAKNLRDTILQKTNIKNI